MKNVIKETLNEVPLNQRRASHGWRMVILGNNFTRKAMAGRRMRACRAQQIDQGMPGKESSIADVQLDD